MINEDVTDRVVNALKQCITDVHEDSQGNLHEFGNVELEISSGRGSDGELQIDCRPRIRTREGLGPIANTWVLSPEFFELWDPPPRLCWIMEAPTFVQLCGRIDGVDVTVNLWSERMEPGTDDESSQSHPSTKGGVAR
jgi:hypothetical protein